MYRLAKNPSGHSCRTFRPGFLWTARFYLNPKRVWHGVPERKFLTVPNIPDFLASLICKNKTKQNDFFWKKYDVNCSVVNWKRKSLFVCYQGTSAKLVCSGLSCFESVLSRSFKTVIQTTPSFLFICLLISQTSKKKSKKFK